jgi:DNA uptake protein ComE-like DNA-binding protein
MTYSKINRMNIQIVKQIFVAAVLLQWACQAWPADTKVAVDGVRAAASKPAKAGTKQAAASAPAMPNGRLVDINSAGRNELMTLPGVTDAVAEKIIAGRPFGSKSHLTTRGIVARDVYEDIKKLVVAKQDAGSAAKLLNK